MKKHTASVFCLIMVFVTAISWVNPVYSANPLAQTDESFHGKMLNSLGIFEDFGGTNFNSETIITKAQMCNIVAGVFWGDTFNQKREHTYFEDVPLSHWALSGINILAETGIVSGNGSGIFEPEKKISLYECLKIWTSALGYDALCLSKGGWPYGYYNTALSLGMLDGLENAGTDTVSGAVLAQLVSNSLEIPFMNQSVGNETFETNPNGTDTILKRRNICVSEGRIIKNDITALAVNASPESDGLINIDGVRYKVGQSGADKYLGVEVKFYYSESGQTDTVLFAYPEYDYEKLVINTDDIVSSSRLEIKYLDNEEKEKKIRISAGAGFILNSKSVNYYDGFFNVKNSELVLTRSGDSASFDVVSINSYIHTIASGVSSDERVLYFKDIFPDGKGFMDIDADKLVVIKESKEVKVSDISKNDVISILKSADGNYIRIEILSGSFSGTVSETGSEKLVINEAEYEISPDFSSKNGIALKVDKTGDFFTDRYEKIFYADFAVSDKAVYGFMFSCMKKEISNTYAFRILSESGLYEEVNLASKVRITDSSYDSKTMSAVDAYSYVTSELKDAPSLIRYELNSESEVVCIELPRSGNGSGSDDGVLRLDVVMKDTQYYAYGRVGSIAHVDDDTKYFVVSKSKTSDGVKYNENTSRVSTAYFTNGNNFASEDKPIHFYSIGSDGFADAVLVLDEIEESEYGNIGSLESYRVYVFEEYSSALDENGDEVNVITAWCDGSEKRLVISEECKSTETSLVHGVENMKLGDAFVIRKDKNGKVSDYRVLKRAGDSKTGYIFGAGGGYYQVYATSTSIFAGKLYSYTSKSMRIKCNDTYYSFSVSSTPVTLVDTKAETVSSGNTSDMIFYGEADPDGGSEIIINADRNSVNGIVIYK